MRKLLRSHAGIAIILLVYTALAVFYSLVTPVFEAPDELWHYLVIRDIADHQSLPIQKPPPAQVLGRQEASQPPLYYLIGAFFLDIVNRGKTREISSLSEVAELNPFGQPGDLQARENRNIVFHAPDEGFPYSGTLREVHLLRLLSIAMGVATVAATYALALELATDWHAHPKALALGAAAVNAGIPQFVFLSGSVNNDNLATAVSSLALLGTIRLYGAKIERRHLTWLGLLIGLLAISKLSGLVLLPVAMLAVLLSKPGNRWFSAQWRALAIPAASLLGTTGLVAGWWYLRNLWLYGDVTGLNDMMAWLSTRTSPYSWSEAGTDLGHFWISTWALFGWSNVPAESYVYWCFGLLVVLSLMGWVRLLARRNAIPERARFGLTVILCYLALLSLSLVRYHLITPAADGRLIFPAISGICAVLFIGIAALVPPRSIQWLALSVAAVLIGIASIVPLRTIEPAYALPSTALAEWRTGLADRVGWSVTNVHEVHAKFGDFLELVAFGLDQDQLRPGQNARFIFEWKRLARVDRIQTFFVQVLDKTGRRVGGIDVPPGKGIYPVHLWPVGQPFYDVYEFPIADDAAAPGVATIIAGTYDSMTGAHSVAVDANGVNIGETPVVGRTKIAPRPGVNSQGTEQDIKAGATLADCIQLSGYSLAASSASPGGTISGVIHWQALRPPPADYVVFVQIVGPDGLIAQYDSQPDGGGYPTSLWGVGEVVADTFTLNIKDAVPEGDYALIAGMYDPSTGQRLKTGGKDYVELQRIRIAP